MKSKKFMLAALALLAITMVLLPLAGCKNDTVPPEVEKQEQGDGGGSETDKNNTAAKLVSISVTPPEQTVYSVGQEFDPTGMEVTATYDDGTTRTVTGTITTDTSTLTQSAGVKTVTVSYKEGETTKTTTFTVTVFPAEVEVLTDYESPNNTGNDWTYVEFGEWPQNIKADNVFVDESKSKEMGMFTYYLGDDYNCYVKYSDKYYKVEPIVWRVLTTSYKAPEGGTVGEILLLAEKILTGGIPYYDWDTNRTVDEATIYPNNYEHSAVRAWLNGLVYPYKGPDDNVQTYKEDYFGKGFLQTAFTADAQSLIADTPVDNSAASTTDAGSNLPPATDYACANTKDKIFLLSEKEATTGAYLKEKDITDEDYGFDEYSESGTGNTRIRVTTDYAKATGAYQDSTEGYVGWWWLRSPYYDHEDYARVVYSDGFADDYYVVRSDGDADNSTNVYDARGGVVPALSISLQ